MLLQPHSDSEPICQGAGHLPLARIALSRTVSSRRTTVALDEIVLENVVGQSHADHLVAFCIEVPAVEGNLLAIDTGDPRGQIDHLEAAARTELLQHGEVASRLRSRTWQ